MTKRLGRTGGKEKRGQVMATKKPQIERVQVKGLDVYAYYSSGKVENYRKPQDIKHTKGIKPIPQTVVKFMREHGDKVR